MSHLVEDSQQIERLAEKVCKSYSNLCDEVRSLTPQQQCRLLSYLLVTYVGATREHRFFDGLERSINYALEQSKPVEVEHASALCSS